MSKIISIKDDIVQIGTDDGGIKEVRRDDVNFDGKVGDRVEIFESETKVVVTKAEDEEKKQEETSQSSNGVNININNTNNNNTNQGQGSTYQGDKKVVNKVVYLLLAFFLGGIGAHKFYAGKIGTGICYLLFCWTYIPAFIAFIEFIIAACAKADSNGNILV